MRYSRQREIIYDIIKGRCDHPTADMIYNSAREIEPNISLGTVYRNLKLLADEGDIITLETEDKRLHYDGDTSRHSGCRKNAVSYHSPPLFTLRHALRDQLQTR